MTRREAREQALALLFEMDFSPEAELEQLREDARLCRDDELDPYALEIAEKFRGNQAFIDAVISRYSTKWKLSRLPRTTAAILRMAICELDYMENVPAGACINEAVELAKKYGGDDDPAYINGVLGGYVRGKNEPQVISSPHTENPQ